MSFPEFQPYSVGLCFASVCTSLTEAETEARLNETYPTGISTRWAKHDQPFEDGTENPHPCEQHPLTHKHYLFSC